MFDFLMTTFALLMWGLILAPRVPTGLFGSIGLLTISMASLVATDESMYNSIEAIESTLLTMCAGVGLVLLQGILLLKRSGAFDADEPQTGEERDDTVHIPR